MKVTKLTALNRLEKKKLVCAYARVSNAKDTMLHSLAAQIQYYKDYINANNEWLFTQVYYDEGISGVKNNRPGFQQMLSDARLGKFNLIVTKSISRFARNTITLLEAIRELKLLNIDVYFEEQRIHTLSSEGELMLTILASYAQEEARSMSENVKWRVKCDFEKGLMSGGNGCFGYKLINRKYIIVPEEVPLVKRIFDLYVSGLGTQAIANLFNKEGIKPKLGKKWTATTINGIISNVVYTGDNVLQKTYVKDHLHKKITINRGEKKKYYVEDDHEPIITKEQFELAAKIKKERAIKAGHNEPRGVIRYPFSGLLKCSICGETYGHRIIQKVRKWSCPTYVHIGKNSCASKSVPNDELERLTKEVLKIETLTIEVVKNNITSILVEANNQLIFKLKNGAEVMKTWQDYSRCNSWTPEMKELARQRALNQHRKENK